jgi:hypothetical protein
MALEEFTGQGDAPVTLARSLDVAAMTLGADTGNLTRLLNDPTAQQTAVTLSERHPPQVAPVIAEGLGDLAIHLLPSAPPEGLRLGLEAHCLFAIASRSRVPAMRHELGHFGRRWARVLLACSRAHLAAGNEPMAQDLAGWLGGLVLQLAPIAVIDASLADLLAECAAHIRQHL